jgi:adenylate kinase
MGRRLLMLGPPGAGKGTQAKTLARAFGIPHISTGDLFRAAIAAGTELGRKVEGILASGELVTDDVTNAIVVERLGEPDVVCGYLMDGYPRTRVQAEAFLAARAPEEDFDAVVLLEASEDALVERLLQRAAAEDRPDDTEDVIRRRFAVYREQTEPLVDYYRRRGLVREVPGEGTIDEVLTAIVLALAG